MNDYMVAAISGGKDSTAMLLLMLRRQYSMIYKRYIEVPELDVDSIVELVNLDKSLFYRDIREATRTISVILFGAENFRDF